MKTKWMALMLLAGGTMFAQTRFSIGVGIGSYGAGNYRSAPPYAAVVPPCPGPGYTWVDGYWNQYNGRNTWVNGYWNAPSYNNAYQYAPRYEQPRYNRDFDRDRDDRGRGSDRDDRYRNDRYRNDRYRNDRDDRGYNDRGGNGFRGR